MTIFAGQPIQHIDNYLKSVTQFDYTQHNKNTTKHHNTDLMVDNIIVTVVNTSTVRSGADRLRYTLNVGNFRDDLCWPTDPALWYNKTFIHPATNPGSVSTETQLSHWWHDAEHLAKIAQLLQCTGIPRLHICTFKLPNGDTHLRRQAHQ